MHIDHQKTTLITKTESLVMNYSPPMTEAAPIVAQNGSTENVMKHKMAALKMQ